MNGVTYQTGSWIELRERRPVTDTLRDQDAGHGQPSEEVAAETRIREKGE